MTHLCPDFGIPEVKKSFDIVQAKYGEASAYNALNGNNNYPLTHAPNGNPSILYKNIYDSIKRLSVKSSKLTDEEIEKLAIQGKSIVYSDTFTKRWGYAWQEWGVATGKLSHQLPPGFELDSAKSPFWNKLKKRFEVKGNKIMLDENGEPTIELLAETAGINPTMALNIFGRHLPHISESEAIQAITNGYDVESAKSQYGGVSIIDPKGFIRDVLKGTPYENDMFRIGDIIDGLNIKVEVYYDDGPQKRNALAHWHFPSGRIRINSYAFGSLIGIGTSQTDLFKIMSNTIYHELGHASTDVAIWLAAARNNRVNPIASGLGSNFSESALSPYSADHIERMYQANKSKPGVTRGHVKIWFNLAQGDITNFLDERKDDPNVIKVDELTKKLAAVYHYTLQKLNLSFYQPQEERIKVQYGLKNLEEFITESITSKALMLELASIKIPESLKYKAEDETTVLDTIYSIIKDLVDYFYGIFIGHSYDESVHATVVAIVNDLMARQREILKGMDVGEFQKFSDRLLTGKANPIGGKSMAITSYRLERPIDEDVLLNPAIDINDTGEILDENSVLESIVPVPVIVESRSTHEASPWSEEDMQALMEYKDLFAIKEGPMNDSELIRIFGNAHNMKRAVNYLADTTFRRSILAAPLPDFTDPDSDPFTTLMEGMGVGNPYDMTPLEYFNYLREMAVKQYQDSTNLYATWDDVPEQRKNERRFFGEFIKMKLVDRNIFTSLMLKVFPVLSIDEQTKLAHEVMFLDPGRIRPERLIAPALRINMESTRYKIFYKTEGGDIHVMDSSSPAKEFIDVSILDEIFTSEFHEALSSYVPNEQMTLLEYVLFQMRVKAENAIPTYSNGERASRIVGSEYSNTVLSYLDKLNYVIIGQDVSSGSRTGRQVYSPIPAIDTGVYFAFHSKNFLDSMQQSDPASTFNFLNSKDFDKLSEFIQKKRSLSEQFFNVIASHYRSMAEYQAVIYSMSEQLEGAHVTHAIVPKYRQRADLLWYRMKSSIRGKTEVGGEYNSIFQDLIENRENDNYSIDQRGNRLIKNHMGVVVLEYTKDDVFKWGSKLDQTDKIKEARNMLMFFGIEFPSNIGKILVANIMNERVDTPITSDELANMLGHMFAAVLSVKDTEGKIWTRRLQNYLGRHTTGRLDRMSDGEDVEYVGNTINADQEIVDYSDVFPLKSFEYDLKKLLSYQEKLIVSKVPNFAHIGDSKRYLKQYTHSITENFMNNRAGFTVLVQRFQDVIANIRTLSALGGAYKDAIMLNPFLGANHDTIIEPLVDPQGLYRVKNIEYLSGFENEYKSGETKFITARDMINASLFASFWNNIKKNNDLQLFKVIPLMFGDSTQVPVITVEFGSRNDRILNVSKGQNGIYSVSLNEPVANEVFNQRMLFRLKMARRGASLWSIIGNAVGNGMENLDVLRKEAFMDSQQTITRHDFKAYEKFMGLLKRHMSNNELYDMVMSANGLQKKQIKPHIKQMMSQLGMMQGVDFNIDYRDGSETLAIGDALYMRDDMIFPKGRDTKAAENIFKWFAMWNANALDSALTEMRHALLKPSFEATQKYFRQNEYDIPEDLINKVEGWNLEHSWIRKPKDSKGKVIEGAEKEWHPVMEAYYLMNWAVGEGVINTSIANVYQYKNASTFVKQSKAAVGMGLVPILGTPGGLPLTTNSVILNDIVIQGTTAYRELFDIVVEGLKLTDSAILTNPVTFLQMHVSYGGQYGLLRDSDRTIKDLHTNVDLATGIGMYDKASKLVINEDHFRNNRDRIMRLMNFMLSGKPVNYQEKYQVDLTGIETNLFNIFKQTIESDPNTSFWNAVRAVHNHISNVRIAYGVDLSESMVSNIEYQSSNKIGQGLFNNYSIEELNGMLTEKEGVTLVQDGIVILTTKNENAWRLILNANTDLNKQTTSVASQSSALIGIGENNLERIQKMNAVDSEMIRRNRDEIGKTLDNTKGKTPDEKYQNFVRNLISEHTTSRTDINNLLRQITNTKIDLNIPFIHNSAVPVISSLFTDGVRFKIRGLKMVQRPDLDGMTMMDTVIDGQVRSVTQEDMDFYRMIGKVSDGQQAERRWLRHYDFFDENGIDLAEQAMGEDSELVKLKDRRDKILEKRRKIHAQYGPTKEGPKFGETKKELDEVNRKIKERTKEFRKNIKKIRPAEAMIPFLWFKDYTGYETIEEFISAHGRVSMAEMFTVGFKVGDGIEYINVLDVIKDASPDYYTDMTPGVQALHELLRDKLGMYLDNMSQENSFIMKTRRGETIQSVTELVKLYESFAKSLMVMGTRIPSTLWGSTHAYEVSGFIYDSGSVIYTSPIKSLFDGSDYDIDTLTVYFRDTEETEGGRFITNMEDDDYGRASRVQLLNRRFDQYWFAYQDPENLDLMLTPLELEPYRVRVQNDKSRNQYDRIGDPASTIRGWLAAIGGKNQVAIFANILMEYARISHLGNEVGTNIAPWLFFDKTHGIDEMNQRAVTTLTILAELLQMSVDNVKELLLEYLNVNTISGNMIAAMAMSQITDENGDPITTADQYRENILNFFGDYYVREIIARAISSKSLREFRINVLDVIDEQRRNIQNELSSKRTKTKYEAQIVYHKKMLALRTKELDEFDLRKDQQSDIDGDQTAVESVPEENAFIDSNNMALIEDDPFPLYRENDTTANKKKVLRDKIKKHESYLKQLTEEGLEKYSLRINEKLNDRMRNLERLYDYANRGRAMFEMSNFFFYQGYPSTESEMQLLKDDLEYLLQGQSIKAFIAGETPIPNGWMQRHRFVGESGTRQFNVFRHATQTRMNRFGNLIAANVMQLINQQEEKDRPKIEITTTGKQGLEQSLNNAFARSNIKSTASFNNQNQYRDEFGALIGDFAHETKEGKGMSSSRFTRGVEIKTGKTRSLVDVVDSEIETSDLVVVFNIADASPQINQQHAMNRAKKGNKVLSIGYDDFLNAAPESDEVIGGIAERIANRVQAIYNKEKDKPVKILFVADDFRDIKFPRENKYQSLIRHERDMFATLNFRAIIENHPVLMEQLISFDRLLDISMRNKITNSAFANSLRTRYMEMQKHTTWTKKRYVSFNNAIWGAVLSYHFAGNTNVNSKIELNLLDGRPITSAMDFDQILFKNKLDLRNFNDLIYFVNVFPRYFEYVTRDLEGNELVDKIMVSENNALYMHEEESSTEYSILNLKNEYLKLKAQYPDLARALMLYAYANQGMSYSLASITSYMDDTFLEDISETIQSIDVQLKNPNDNPKRSFIKMMDRYFMDNAITQDFNLGRSLRVDDFDGGIVPKYMIRRTPFIRNGVFELFIRQYYTHYEDPISQEGDRFDNQTVNTINEGYTMVNNFLTGNLKMVPLSKHTVVTTQVSKPSDIKVIDNLFNPYSSGDITLYYRRGHNYVKGEMVIHGVHGHIIRTTPTSITFRKDNGKYDPRVRDSRGNVFQNSDTAPRFRQGVSHNVMEVIAKKLTQAFPSLKVSLVNNQNTDRPGRLGYVLNGIVYFNTDLMNPTTMVHELFHPLYVALKSSSKPSHQQAYKTMYAAAKSEIDNAGEVALFVMSNYPELTGDDLIEEVAMHMAEMVTPDKAMEIIVNTEQRSNFFSRIYQGIMKVWKAILNAIGNVFGVRLGNVSALDEITPYSTFTQVVEAIFTDVFINQESTYNGYFLHGLAVLDDFARESRFGGRVDPLPSTKGLEDILLVGIGTANYDLYKNEALVNSIYEQTVRKNGIFEAFGRTWNFKKIFNATNITDEDRKIALKKVILDEVVPEYSKKANILKEGLKGWLTNDSNGGNGSASKATLQEFFPVGINSEQEVLILYSSKVMRLLRSEIGHTKKNFQIMFYSDLGKLTAENPLSRLYNGDFAGEDPLIVIYDMQSDDNGHMSYEIGLIDVTSIPLIKSAKRGLGDRKLITANFMPDSRAKDLGVKMNANYSNVLHLEKGLLAMELINRKDVSVKVRKIINIHAKGFAPDTQHVDFDTIIPVFQALSKKEDFMAMMPSSVKQLLSNADTFAERNYREDWFRSLQSLLESKDLNTQVDRGWRGLDRAYKAFINDELGPYEFLRAIREQQEWLRSVKIVEKTSDWDHYMNKALDDEYNILSQVASQIEWIHRNGVKQQSSLLQNLMHTAYNIRNETLSSTIEAARTYQQQLEGLFIKEKEQMDKEFDKYFERHGYSKGRLRDYVLSTSSELFDRMFYDKRVAMNPEVDGETKMYDALMIHHDVHAIETQRALNHPDPKLRITFEDVAFGKVLVDRIEMNLKRLIRADLRNDISSYETFHTFDKDAGWVLDKEALEKEVNRTYEENWIRGMVPAMGKTGGELIAENKILQGLRRMVMQQGDFNTVFEEVMSLRAELGGPNKWPSNFLPQVQGAGEKEHGGMKRMTAMGVESDGVNIFLTNEARNGALSHNLTRIMAYLTADSLAKEFYETYVIPLMDDAYIIAASVAISSTNKTEQEETFRALTTWGNKMIYGKREDNYLFPLKLSPEMDQKVAATLNTFLRITTFNGVALSTTVAITSLVANMTEMFLEGIATKIGGNPYDLPTPKEIAIAAKEFMLNHKKVLNVAWKNQVVEATMWELLNSDKFYKNERQLATQRNAHVGNRLTDYVFRYLGMTAMMVHDGTWWAFDEEGNYNERLDRRFFKEDGSFIDRKSKELYEWIKDDLLHDPRYEQKEQGPLVMPYAARDQKRLKQYTDEFVIGAFDSNTNPMGKQFFVFNMVTQFKNFMLTKLETRLGTLITGRTTSPEGALRKIKENPDGTYSREWLALIKEGTWVTLGKYLFSNGKSLVHSVPGIARILETMDVIEEHKSWQKWSQLDELTRHNIVRASLDVMAFLTVLLVSMGLKPDNKEERLQAMKHARLLRALKTGVLTTMSTAPDQLIDLATGWAVIGQVQRIRNLVMGVEPMKQISYLVPGGGTARLINDYVQTDNE